MMQPTVRPLTAADTSHAAQVLSRAFQTDPFFGHVFQSSTAHQRHAPWMFASWLRQALLEGGAWVFDTPSGRVGGAMVCHAPDAHGYRLWHLLRSGMVLTPFKLPWRVFQRLYRIGAQVEQRRAELMQGQRYWYCQVLGVDPAEQGKGAGGALLRSMLARADAHDGCACYLETGLRSNAEYYMRFGFELRDTQPMDAGAWTIYYMSRPARA